MQCRDLPEGWDAALPVFAADTQGLATRDASSQGLNAIAARMPWLLGGAADLSPSTKTQLSFDGAGVFEPGARLGRGRCGAGLGSLCRASRGHHRDAQFWALGAKPGRAGALWLRCRSPACCGAPATSCPPTPAHSPANRRRLPRSSTWPSSLRPAAPNGLTRRWPRSGWLLAPRATAARPSTRRSTRGMCWPSRWPSATSADSFGVDDRQGRHHGGAAGR